ncbi:MAG TPA: YqiA/YcfP family alpha/beta fold hydrolase, partial [Calditrichia bacterium]|nr:YqiA/YcfP family alpha/beta fold hydrolase [Calditrichia bacterium]
MNYLYLHGFCSGPGSFKGQYLKEKFARKNLVLQTPDLNGA